MKRLYVAVFLIFAMSSAGIPSFAGQANLLVNPGFEKVDPMGWGGYGDSAYDTELFRSGKQSGKVWAWDYGDGLFEQYVKIVPGTEYKASVYAFSKPFDAVSGGSNAWIQIEWYTIDDVAVSEPVKSPPITAAKAKIKVIIQAPKKETAGSCYFDDADFSSLPPM